MKCFFSIFFTFFFIFLSIFGTNCFYGYLFPIKYADEVEFASETFDIEKAIIFSVINVESHFKKDIISSKGARGLMQVMPSTASMVANEIGMEHFDLGNAEDNILIGTAYLASMIERFENLEVALCAYNAGPTNVMNWLKNESYSKDGSNLDEIPFEETANYISKFNKNYKYYASKK